MDRCEGSGKVARDVRRSTLGGKFFGKSFGTCPTCGAPVGIRKGTKIANPHNPKEK